MARVHPTSIVDRNAEVADDVVIGPFCHVHAGVRIGSGTRLVSHVVIMGNTSLGPSNVIHPFAVIGGDAQVRKGPHVSVTMETAAEVSDAKEMGPAAFDAKEAGSAVFDAKEADSAVFDTKEAGSAVFGAKEANSVVHNRTEDAHHVADRPVPRGFETMGEVLAGERRSRHALEIGAHNVFRESVTVNTSSADGTTRIGSHNLFMAGCHVAHDVVVGSRCVVANGVQLAGHVAIEDWVTFGGLAAVAQHLRVGEGSFVAAGAMCERDVPPFVIAQGDRARVRAINVVGLERRGVPPNSIASLRRAFRRLWGARTTSFDEALRALDRSDPWVAILASWLEDPARSIKAAKRSGTRR